jgi:hypothetical protein
MYRNYLCWSVSGRALSIKKMRTKKDLTRLTLPFLEVRWVSWLYFKIV